MRNLSKLLFLILLLTLGACSEEQKSTTQSNKKLPADHLLSTQLETLDKAKDAAKLMQTHNEEQQKRLSQ